MAQPIVNSFLDYYHSIKFFQFQKKGLKNTLFQGYCSSFPSLIKILDQNQQEVSAI